MKALARLLALGRARRRDRDMTEEMRLHLEQRTEEFMAEGLSAADAREAALRKFGGVEQVKFTAREQRVGAGLEALGRDIRLAVRSLCHAPLFTVTALLTLALGLGANTAIFSLIDKLMLQPAPYPAADRLMRVYRTESQSNTLPHSLPDYRDIRDHSRSFEAVTAYQFATFGLAEPGQPAKQITAVQVSADYFHTLMVQPSIGRAFTAEEQQPGRDAVALLTDDFWQRHFGRDPSVIGQTIRLDSQPVTILGVMPASSAYPLFWGRVDVIRPLPLLNDWRELRSARWLNIIGRLQPGVSRQQAQAELSGLAEQIARQYPDSNTGSGLRLRPLHESAIDETGRRVTWLTFGLAGFVLLIACANLSSLQLARATANARQFAVRVALGAPRAALIRQCLVETMVLAIVGGALGVAIAITATRIIGSQVEVGGDHVAIALNLRMLMFAFAAAIATGALFGAVPAWVVSQTGVNDVLKQQARGSTGGRAQHRLRHALIVFEIALTLVLLGGATVFLRGLNAFVHRDLGWHSSGVLVGTLTLPVNRYPTNEVRHAFHEQVVSRVQTLPGVENVALASFVPITAVANAPEPLHIEGRPPAPAGHEPLAHFILVGPHYFDTIGVQLVRGRLIPDDIRPDSPAVAVISESMARTLWPGEDPIGKRVSRLSSGSWAEVIGVVRDISYAADMGAPDTRMMVYQSLVKDPWGYFTVVLRAPNAEAQKEPLRRVIASLDADLPVSDLRTIDGAVNESQRFYRLANRVLAGFAALGLLLSAIGLYGVISNLVLRRTPEFGIRLALGAPPRALLWDVLATGLKLSMAGVAVGLVGTVAIVRVLVAVAPALPASSASVIGAVSLLLIGIASLACWFPAYRATKVNPLIALRSE